MTELRRNMASLGNSVLSAQTNPDTHVEGWLLILCEYITEHYNIKV